MGIGDTAICTSLVSFSVDVLDDVNSITTSGTYFLYNGFLVDSQLTSISGGYNILYETTPSGNIVLDLFVSNNSNDIFTQSYEFNYGYNVVWNKVVYWGTDKEVPINIICDNAVVAPATSYYSTFFHTHKPFISDFSSDVSTEGSGGFDLITTIVPQSKYFIHGKTYSVTISGVKDYSGNVLDAMTFTFKIEDE